MSSFLIALTILSLTASGIVGGVFFIFSTTIMPVLGARPAVESIGTMKKINEVIVRTSFIAIFMGNTIASLLLIGAGLLDPQRPGSWLAISGAAVYLVGSFGVTVAFNVPRNNALAALAPDGPDASAVWNIYLREWTFWNHVRTAACIVSALLLACSLIYRSAANGS